MTALAGNVWSGVEVASTIRSIDDASTLAAASAAFAASSAISEVSSPVEASRRSWMPVRWTIHSSDVSTALASSWLVTTRDGR